MIYQCGHYLIISTRGYSYIVTKRRIFRKIPYREVLFASDWAIFSDNIEKLKLYILIKERSLSLVSDERFLGTDCPFGIRLTKRLSLYMSSNLSSKDIDNLYSELVLVARTI